MKRPIDKKNIKSIVVKVGTSILTQKGRFDRGLIGKLALEVSDFLKKGISVSIVSSGAIGAGMMILKEKNRPKTMEGLQAAAAVGQRYLMQCYEESFSKKGFSTAQVLLTWDDMAHPKRFLNAKRTLKEIQKRGLVPIINENDTVATDEIRFGDNDRLSALLSILVEADLMFFILCLFSQTVPFMPAETPTVLRVWLPLERTKPFMEVGLMTQLLLNSILTVSYSGQLIMEVCFTIFLRLLR